MRISLDELRSLLAEAGVKPELAKNLDASSPLLRQGVDSVDFPAFCALVEERYGLAMDDEHAFTLKTLEDFARHIEGAQ
ncbi:acyl carrier protein [Humidesulfovibrio mexicanus]|jgi:acyl carrier protein|uniref:Acyl carrier protein n=1 Tax=Humidesulfovibrio mexicanus TaxID=147047 RepID=A0A238YZ59_9BACT|nr:acyl carrier protein [Humidesulfovibrio mexicanus]SNR75819.1 acyl carrier protein [Humidesulfovibrio mexicanus]